MATPAAGHDARLAIAPARGQRHARLRLSPRDRHDAGARRGHERYPRGALLHRRTGLPGDHRDRDRGRLSQTTRSPARGRSRRPRDPQPRAPRPRASMARSGPRPTASSRAATRCILPSHYVRRTVATLRRTGAATVGGLQRPLGRGFFQRAVALAMTTRLGSRDTRFQTACGTSMLSTQVRDRTPLGMPQDSRIAGHRPAGLRNPNVSGHYGPWLRDCPQCDGGSWWCGPRSERIGASANSDFHIRGVSSMARLAGCTLIRWSTSTR